MTIETALQPSKRSHRGVQVAMVVIGIVTLLGLGGLAVMIGQLRTTASGRQTTIARASLVTVASAADASFARTNSFAADAAGLSATVGDLRLVGATEPSDGAQTISVDGQPLTFIAAAFVRPQTCIFVRRSTDPATIGTTWNTAQGGATSCTAANAPADGWSADLDQRPVEPSPPSPR